LHNTKPPSKLINAWHANIPFIGGFDSAYTQVGTPGINYLRAKTPEEILKAVLLLKNNPLLYEELVQKGKQKAIHYTNEKIAKIWEEVLLGPVYQRYEKWLTQPKYEWLRFKTLLDIGLLRHETKQVIKIFIPNKSLS
jgi:hypothetical protein